MQNVNDMAAQGVAQRMGGAPAGPGPPGMGGPPPGMGPPMGGGQQADPQAVEAGRGMLQKLTMLLTSDPNVMLALAPDIQSFGNVLKQFAGQAGGQPGMGGPPPGAGGPPPMGGGSPMPGGGGPPMGGPAG